MENSNIMQFDAEIQSKKKQYGDCLTEHMGLKEVLEIAVRWYEDVNTINEAYYMISDPSSLDEINAYYIACEILHRIPVQNLFPSKEHEGTEDDIEKYKVRLSDLILNSVLDRRAVKILVFEPHHDDFMGSASSILYADRDSIQTIVYTMARSGDERDDVDLAVLHQRGDIPTRKRTSVVRHVKCQLEDYDYFQMYEEVEKKAPSEVTDYAALVRYYTESNYDVEKLKQCLERAVLEFVSMEAEEKYILLPIGVQHPMHILTAYYGTQAAIKAGLSEKIIYYIDHPYDFQLKETLRLDIASVYYSTLLNCRFVRMDGTNIRQKDIGSILSVIYGEKHYGEFDGTLDKTLCSYYVQKKSRHKLEELLHLQENNILYATFQAKPFLKTGGSGEVAYSYIKSIKPYVNKAAIIMPKYKKKMQNFGNTYIVKTEVNGKYYKVNYSENGEKELIDYEESDMGKEVELLGYDRVDKGFWITLNDTEYSCHLEKYLYDNVTYYLLDIEGCFESDNIFDNDHIDMECAAFSLAVMESLKNNLDFMPTRIHCNDYQTALIPLVRKVKYANYMPSLKIMYTIHFYGYKGIYSKRKVLGYLGISESNCGLCLLCKKDENCLFNRVSAYSKEDIEKLGIPNDKINLMKTGIIYADVVTTVSKGYASTIQTYPDFSTKKVYGIRNGIAIEYRELLSDKEGITYMRQTKDNWFEAKKTNKEAFQKEFGLEINPDIPMFCMVSRLNATKGIEDIKNIFARLMEMDLQLVIVGDDDRNASFTDKYGNEHVFSPYADFFKLKMEENPGKFFYSPFSEEMEFKTYSASDVLLMPSRDEACGTTQILAMKYGALPIVSKIDSFNDTLIDYNLVYECTKEEDKEYVHKPGDQMDKGIGFFSFKDDCWTLLDIIKMMCEKLHGEEKSGKWRKAVNSTVCVDFSWDNKLIREYLELYNGML